MCPDPQPVGATPEPEWRADVPAQGVELRRRSILGAHNPQGDRDWDKGHHVSHLGRHYPAMALVQVVALVEDLAKVEIEATAVLESSS